MSRVMYSFDVCEGVGTTHQTVTAATTASMTIPAQAGAFFISAATACSVTLDGSTPSATNGLQIPASVAPIFIPCANSAFGLKFFCATSAVINVTFLR